MFGPPENEILKGVIDRVRFASADGGFAVCDLKTSPYAPAITIVGNIMSAQPGESVEIEGEWVIDRKFGKQFKIKTLRTVLPVTEQGIIKYLSGGFIPGIGPGLAQRIVDAFGAQTLDILDENPDRLRDVAGIGKKRAKSIIEAWQEQRSIRGIMVFLQSHGVSPAYAARIYRLYGDRAAEIVQENPYRLAEDVYGIGFKKADQIAQELGIRRDSIDRLRAGILFTLRESSSDGHMFLPLEQVRQDSATLMAVDPDMIGEGLESLRMSQDVVLEPVEECVAAVYTARSHQAELTAARHLHRLTSAEASRDISCSEEQLIELEEDMGITLASAQREAVQAVWEDKVSVITGGPGTGKTTIVRAIVARGLAAGATIALAAPTGRAAKRLAESTGEDAKTLHRLLMYSFQEGFQINEMNPLEVDLLIVDESSMIDSSLLGAIVRALPDDARLLLVGDVDQLPSVGPGNVLADIIASGAVRTVRLTEIFRQAQESAIVTNAHRVNSGELPVAPPRQPGQLVDFYMIKADDPATARERIIKMVTDRIPNAFGFDPIEDVQILSPMRRGSVGCDALNDLLQEKLISGEAPELRQRARRWRLGDKVMQTRNNYDMDVYNGDVGRIVGLNREDVSMEVSFDGRVVVYESAQLDELQLAYAVTVHKSQGSEYPVVVIPVITQHYVMLQRNLLYTGITRAKKVVILVGTEKALGIAVRNAQARERYTRLVQRLQAFDA